VKIAHFNASRQRWGTRRNPFWDYPIAGFTLPQLATVANENYKRLRELLVGCRKAAGMTQVELSSRLKRPQSFVSKYERGERRLDVVEFGEVAKALDIDPSKFLAAFYRSGE